MKIQEPKDHSNVPDPFSEYLRGRLEDHTSPVSPAGFDRIEKELNRRRARKTMLAAGLVLAAMLAGLLWLLPFFDDLSTFSEPEEVTAQVEERESLPAPADQPVADEPVRPIQVAPSSPVLIAKQTIVRAEEAPVSLPAEEVRDEMPIEENEDTPVSPAPPKQEEKKVVKDATPKRRQEPQPKSRPYQPKASATAKAKKSGWLVSAGFGLGGNIPTDVAPGFDFKGDLIFGMNEEMSIPDWSGLDMYYNNESSWSQQNKVPHPDSYIDENHRLPLSFGVTVRKRITDRFALESGVVYTYLYSTFSGYVAAKNKATLSQHYLGIPVNAVVYLYDNSGWSIYASGGAMVEKGIQSVYSNIIYVSAEEHVNTTKGSIDGLQYSVNAALGISYRVQRNWSLYFEPRFSYYFDNDQPRSFRTENPVSIGLGAGLRYEF